jgi:glycosyltransferase involved in cell wall biosynthesis
MKHRILIVSLGNVPYNSDQIVEGGGLRCWGLAKSLSKAGHEVRLCIPNSYLPTQINHEANLVIIPYDSPTNLILEITGSSAVIYPAGAPHISNLCIENSRSNTILIADAYVPIHVEVSSRQFEDQMINEEADFHSLSPFWLRAISEAHVVLCASLEQQAYYLGILAGVGRLSPITYARIVILVVPFGYFPGTQIERPQEPQIRTRNRSTLKILWYGGFYPWFDTEKFADLLSKLDAALTIETDLDYTVQVTGAVNPFVQDKNFELHTKKQISRLATNPKVSFSPWLPFDQRHKSFRDMDLVICLTSDGYENQLAWRTRYLDFIEYSIPLFTNSEDPLAKKITDNRAGWQISSQDMDSFSNKLLQIIRNPDQTEQAKKNYMNLKNSFTWDLATAPLIETLQGESLVLLRNKTDVADTIGNPELESLNSPAALELIRFGLRNIKTQGLFKTIDRTRRYFISKKHYSRSRSEESSQRAMLFVHQLDYSGSPLIATEIAVNLMSRLKEFNLTKIVIYCFGMVDKNLAKLLREKGVQVLRVEQNYVPRIKSTDLVIINGLAQSENLFREIIKESKSLEQTPIILAHEDRPLIHSSQEILNQIGNTVNSGHIRILSPSLGTTRNLQRVLKSSLIETQPYSINSYPKCAENFDAGLNIHLTGSTYDFRKNQHLALVLISLIDRKIKIEPLKYRKIHLTLIGVDEDTFYGNSILKLAESMKDFVTIHPRTTKEEAIEIMKTCNTVLCVSEYEALPLFVCESMAMGQIVLRNNCSGVDEQLVQGKNGILLDLSNLHDAIEQILILLDRDKTSNEQLKEMGISSRALVKEMLTKDRLEFLKSKK